MQAADVVTRVVTDRAEAERDVGREVVTENAVVTENSDEKTAVDPATADSLKALAGETRQKVMRQPSGGIELTVDEIAERRAPKPSTASEHLSLLRRCGLVISRKEGKQVFHRADGATTAERLSAFQAYLALCCPPDRTG
ncbi:ArsR/SmtB family transcription factor [Streptomyces sp. NPDC093149]|uniref:ArsR/SmtB family transcription factor n=1 Tax=Streptomyces sp. NPDC093149 TaxID=3366031 RepID=UPI00382F1FB0